MAMDGTYGEVQRCDGALLQRVREALDGHPSQRAWNSSRVLNLGLETLELLLSGDGVANFVMRDWLEGMDCARGDDPVDAARRRLMVAAAELERVAARFG